MWLLVAAVVASLSSSRAETFASRFEVGPDGSISGPFPSTAEGGNARFSFGFGTNHSARVWKEGQGHGETLRRQWMTNGVRYTQTFLLAVSPRMEARPSAPTGEGVLLVNIQGENMASEYSLAAAALSLTGARGQTISLELTNGCIWALQNGQKRKSCVAALEIPAPGVRKAQGPILQFEGNMPPSEKGSLTLKIPLRQIEDDDSAEQLADIDFAQALRQALKPPK